MNWIFFKHFTGYINYVQIFIFLDMLFFYEFKGILIVSSAAGTFAQCDVVSR